MHFDTASKLVTLAHEACYSHKIKDEVNFIDNKIDLWMGLFGKVEDFIMIKAIEECIKKCKYFPGTAEINEEIKALQFANKMKRPKQLPWSGEKYTGAFEVSRGIKGTQEYLEQEDISLLHQYAKTFFPDITSEAVRKYYSLLMEGFESKNMCLNCTVNKNTCLTSGWVVKHWMNEDGSIKNEMAPCHKNFR